MVRLSTGNPLGQSIEGSEINLGGEATGDIIYYTAGGTYDNLAIGTANQIMRVSAGGIPEWAAGAGWSLVAQEDLSGGAGTTISFSALDLNSDGLYMIVWNLDNATAGGFVVNAYVESDTTDANYRSERHASINGAVTSSNQDAPSITGLTGNETSVGIGFFWRDALGRIVFRGISHRNATTAIQNENYSWCTDSSKTNLTTLDITAGGNMDTGSTVSLFKLALT